MDDVKITVLQDEPIVKNGITYDTEIWLFDHGKKGTAKIIKRIPRPGLEAEREKNRARIQDALQMMLRDKYCAAT